MGYKDHGLQAVLIELLLHSGDGTTAATGAGSLHANVLPTFDIKGPPIVFYSFTGAENICMKEGGWGGGGGG